MTVTGHNPEDYPTQGVQTSEGIRHSGSSNIPESMRDSHPTGEFDDSNLEKIVTKKTPGGEDFITTPDSPATDPSTLKEHYSMRAVLPPKENQFKGFDDNPEGNTGNSRRTVLIAGGAIAAVGLVGAGFVMGNSGGEESPKAPSTEAAANTVIDETEGNENILDTAPSQTTIAIETPEVTGSDSTDENVADEVDNTPLQEGMIDRGNGFTVPYTRPERVDTPPEIIESNDTDVVLAQIARIEDYVTTTGDFSYLQYIYVSETSELAMAKHQAYEGGEEARVRHGMENFFYYTQIERDTEEMSTLDPSQTTHIIPVKTADLGFDEGPVDTAHFENLQKLDVTLQQKEVVVDGETLTVWVIVRGDNTSFKQYNNYSGLFAEPL